MELSHVTRFMALGIHEQRRKQAQDAKATHAFPELEMLLLISFYVT